MRLALLATALLTTGAAPEIKKRASEPSRERTRCATCHTETSWSIINYAAHDETRFPLTGAHEATPCLSCHSSGISAPITNTTCGSCHLDAHGGRLGMYCEGCHDTNSWKGAYDPDIHRKSNFPLSGAHAFLPCQECHSVADERLVISAAASCASCHQADYLRASRSSIDHQASGFDSNCQSCHATWTFKPARFIEHDSCFRITGGPHRSVGCGDCHDRTTGLVRTGACATSTYDCIDCHEHSEGITLRQHSGVPGYEYRSPKCYSCHRFAPPR